MNLTVNQTIIIHNFRVNSVSSSSVLQIGSSGMIQGLSNLYNTGGFTAPAPALGGAQPLSDGPSPVTLTPLITLAPAAPPHAGAHR